MGDRCPLSWFMPLLVALDNCGPFASSCPFWAGAGAGDIPSAPCPVGVGLVGGGALGVVPGLAIMHRDLAGEELGQGPEPQGGQGASGVHTLLSMGVAPALFPSLPSWRISLPGEEQWRAGFLEGMGVGGIANPVCCREKRTCVGEVGFLGPVPGECQEGCKVSISSHMFLCSQPSPCAVE